MARAPPTRPLPPPRVPVSYSEDGNSELHVACYLGSYDEALMLLLNGHNSSERNILKETPLHHCTAQGHLDVMMLLLDAGADVNSLSSGKQTPLYQAMIHGNRDATELLLCYGASVYEPEPEPVGKLTMSIMQLADHVQICGELVRASLGQVHSLQHLCRVAIRRCLGAGRRRRMRELPLPKHIVSFLCSLPVARSNELHQNWGERRRSSKSLEVRRHGDAKSRQQPPHMVAGIHVARKQQ